jgi:2-oxoglutarate dehydrogenase E2 component (dihydrolipoamide succinyltransferase)
MTQIVVPTLGESVTEATVARWLKKEGESVSADEPVVELETDKVTLEVNAPQAGTVSKIVAPEGSNVKVGALLGELGAANDAKPKPATVKDEKKPEAAKPAANQVQKPAAQHEEKSQAAQSGPAARKAAADNKIDTAKLSGTGKDGRVTKGDVLEYADKKGGIAATSAPEAVSTHPVSEEAAMHPREERVKMTRLRQRIAVRLKEAQNNAAMLTTFNEVDMTEVMAARNEYKEAFEKRHGVKLGFMSFFVKACVNALKEFPAVNAEVDDEDIVYKNYYDLGVAVSTPQGLIVPVVRGCDEKSMAAIEKKIADLGTRAREGKLSMDELTGGTFTITNGGTFGSLMSTPILNPPQSGILGMHKIQQRPVVMKDGKIEARPMMYLALSYDHRIVDGREAVSFLVRVKEAIEDPQRLLLDI